ncbi:MAG: MBL fold metallo-hydrolase [Gammaproteobacteria bacterium]|nr:MBL fold metallo-hydrolase [Gammaproteobacteria bacterium]MCP5416169.1 MBL fold metallo-hydrolase [Chromatiaceae bacterium]
MRFASLGSGSRGNATLIESGSTRLLLDCGFTARELEQRLAMLGIAAESLHGILVTHEHQDHIRGVGVLARRFRLPVWLTHGTLRSQRLGEIPDVRIIHGHQVAITIGGVRVTAYPVPHDAHEPVQFVFETAQARVGVLTDAGTITPHIVEMLSNCSALLLECNHDREMLVQGPYPIALQRRIAGSLGHLSNHQAACFLEQVYHAGLKRLVVAHISEQNNSPELACKALITAVPGIAGRLTLTCQDRVSEWFEG